MLTDGSGSLLAIGNSGLAAPTVATANRFANDGSVILAGGSGSDTATLNLSGAASDAGEIIIGTGGVLALGGRLTVTGSLLLDGATVSGGTLAGAGTIGTAVGSTDTLENVTIAASATFTAGLGLGSTLTVEGLTVNGALSGSGFSTLDFGQPGTDSMTNISGFAPIGLASGGANSLTLTDANFAGVGVGGRVITVNDGNTPGDSGLGSTVNASGLSATNSVVVHAGDGNDVLTGGPGNDVFYAASSYTDLGETTAIGAGGANQFVFSSAAAGDFFGRPQMEITDFGASSANEIVFSNSGFNLGLSGATSTPQPLPADLFTTSFSNTTQRFVYDTVGGTLYYGPDGSGSSIAGIAQLDGAPNLTAAHLFFIS